MIKLNIQGKILLSWALLAGLFYLFPGFSLQAQKLEKVKAEAIEAAKALGAQVDMMSEKLWEYSETALLEDQSAKLLMEQLEKAGFSLERNVAGMPTAFVASYGSGSPVIGILAEFDALPGVGNEPVPEKKARKDGITSGHGCGHNLFGAASVGGALALAQVIEKRKLSGTVKLFGTPAEETVVGKVYMAKAGVFDGVDAVIDWHPGTDNSVKNQSGRAMNNFEIEFFGQAAHASADPWNGRSALDAVEMMNYGVNLMREHVKPTTRIHYVIPRAGDAPNVVPEYAKVWYFVRDVNRDEVNRYYQRILKIAEGAALATATTHKVFLITGVHEYLLNRPMQEALQKNMVMIGAPDFTEEEQRFGRTLQAFVNKPQTGFSTEIAPLADQAGPVSGGSTDVAEVSWITPTAGFSITTAAEDVPWHSWATSACHGTTAGRKGARIASQVIAATGVDLLMDEELLAAAKAYFQEKSQGKKYESPLPLDQKVPLPGK
ncbi:MAG: amidohydrolase [Bacteroidota bacterium]